MAFLRGFVRLHGWRAAGLALLCLAAYWPFLLLPRISDDYIQIQLGFQYGPVSEWNQLFRDVLYRCRATSILITYWTVSAFGSSASLLNASSLLLHFGDTLLVFAAGSWPRIGYRLSFVAACFFAVYQRPQEAVIWYAALPELLVFGFVMAGLLCWIRFLDGLSWRWFGAAAVCYVLALGSKESAVVFAPLALGIAWLERRGQYRVLIATAPFFLAAAVYFGAAHASRSTHLHFNDGTFSLTAPFVFIAIRSMGRMFWIWGLAASAALLYWRWNAEWRWLAGVLAWMFVALLPYSFLTYQGSVPSRHTYLASAGIAILIGRAYLLLRDRPGGQTRALALAAMLCLGYQVAYLWIYKYPQYVERAAPTERLLDAVKAYRGPVELTCFPYGIEVAQRALEIGTNGEAWLVQADTAAADGALRFNGCAAARN